MESFSNVEISVTDPGCFIPDPGSGHFSSRMQHEKRDEK
jgi:hypothetical protein